MGSVTDHVRENTGLPMPVCGNTAMTLADTRYAPHFRIDGDRSVHYGPFDCSLPASPTIPSDEAVARGCC